MLILPKYKELYIPQPVAHTAGTMEGFYKFDAVKPDGRIRPLTGWIRNLITNTGLNNIGNSNSWMNSCYVGTGNTPPAFTDTALNTYRATNNSTPSTSYGAQAAAPYYGWIRRVYRFNQGVASGNLTEVGIGPTSAALSSRSLILDGGGNPTTITVLAIEQLDVTWECRIYPALTDTLSVIQLDGADYNCIARAEAVTASGWAGTSFIPNKTGNGNSVPCTMNDHDIVGITGDLPWDDPVAFTVGSYTNGNYYTDIACFADINNANFPVRSMTFSSNRGEYQYRFGRASDDARIPKDATKELTINIRIGWARHP